MPWLTVKHGQNDDKTPLNGAVFARTLRRAKARVDAGG